MKVLSKQFCKKNRMLLGAVAICALSVAGTIAFKTNSANAESPAVAAETPVVEVQTVQKQNIRVWSQYSGRLEAVDYAEIRPEIAGRITDIRFQDGQIVNAGDILLVIDPSSYEAQVERAAANLASAAAKAQFTKTELNRAETLIASQAISQTSLDQRINENRSAQANMNAAEADLKQAKINLDHAFVKAPISGRTGRPEITIGNLVQSSPNAPLLTTIVSSSAIYADFDVDEQTYIRSIRNSATTIDQEHLIPVELTLQNDAEHIYKGTIYSFDDHINSQTGTIRARAKFNNEDGKLIPGMFASINMANGSDDTALAIPENAIATDQNKKFTYIVGADNKVAYRELTLGQKVNGQRIILKGIAVGDRVIISGLQQLRPDIVVHIKDTTK